MTPKKMKSSKNRRAVARSLALVTLGTLAAGAVGVACSAAPDGESASSTSSAVGTTTAPPAWTGPYGAADLEKAYSVPTSYPANATVAVIVQQADDGNFDSDLAVYRAQYGLPPCTQANKCLTKITENNAPAFVSRSSSPIAAELDIASAGCPSCKLLLVEMSGMNESDFVASVQQAASLGASTAVFIESSWGAQGNPLAAQYPAYDAALLASGVTIFAGWEYTSFGSWPLNSPSVVNVGVTALTRATEPDGSGVGGSEVATPEYAVAGCSTFSTTSYPKPSWQKDTGCANRTTADISATMSDAWTYSTAAGGWVAVSGTQVATPLVAGIFAQTGKGKLPPKTSYANPGWFSDITSGTTLSAGQSCTNPYTGAALAPYLCNAAVGYDAPTGLGTPIGVAMAGAPANVFFVGAPTSPNSLTGLPMPNLMNELTVSPGLTSQNSIPISATGSWANSSSLQLSFSGWPDGVSPILSPMYAANPGGGNPWVILSLKAAAGIGSEQRIVTVTGTDNGVTYQTQLEVVVEPCVVTTSCGANTCGSMVNNCGVEISCGTCPSGETCGAGICCPVGQTYSATLGRCSLPAKTPPVKCGGKGQPACE